MADLGDPASYLVLEEGTKVVSSDGEEVGRVAEVIADTVNDIFDGIVITKGLLPTPGSRHYVPGDEVDEIYERGVVLALDAAAVEALPEHS